VETIHLKLEPASVPEWEAEDEVSGVLADDSPVSVDDEAARAMLNEVSVNLPRRLDWTELMEYVKEKKTLGEFQIPADNEHYDYYMIEAPLTLIVPQGQQLVRLRLRLDLDAKDTKSDPVLAYDLFPSTQVDLKKILDGSVALDIGEGLQFALVAAGVPGPVANIAKCLGFKLNLPFQWTTKTATVQSSARMSNPVEWSITDEAIQGGFSASAIVRAPKGRAVDVFATLYGELRRKYLGVFGKAQFKAFTPSTYRIGR
jgi:hypothetical protein